MLHPSFRLHFAAMGTRLCCSVKWLILDEADKLFEEGLKSFRDQFNQIYAACCHPERKVGLFSATWTNSVAKWGRKNLPGLMTVSVGQRNAATSLVDQELLFVGSEPGKLLAFRDLVRTGMQPPVLVFVDSKVCMAISKHCRMQTDVCEFLTLGSSATTVQRIDLRWYQCGCHSCRSQPART